jgi:hypothetical protein
VAECPFEFYHLWVTNPLAAQKMAERVTRPTIGVKCCPVVSPGIHNLLVLTAFVHFSHSICHAGWNPASG